MSRHILTQGTHSDPVKQLPPPFLTGEKLRHGDVQERAQEVDGDGIYTQTSWNRACAWSPRLPCLFQQEPITLPWEIQCCLLLGCICTFQEHKGVLCPKQGNAPTKGDAFRLGAQCKTFILVLLFTGQTRFQATNGPSLSLNFFIY